ncbi:MAG: hypothetical protein PHG26_03265 [Dehalococcoidales bacterium]|nr:hypothetical protein [Dehalococcoidales bacterium]
MENYEKLGVFYLGKNYDLKSKKTQEQMVLYDSKDLVTHAVCVGMTGSGKTGLCVSLIEEAAMDGIPAICIDPKGDLTNLLLTFPDLKPEDFLPWINSDDARKKGLTDLEFAVKQAELWKNGLASWGQSGERIRRLKQSADFNIYTPGSTAGIPVSIIKSFDAPPRAIIEDNELFHERISTTATSLLGIIGMDVDPITSREHILISTLLRDAWSKGQNMSIAGLISQIQAPSVSRIGVMDLDSFFPAKDRFALALAFNNLLAAPGFSTWLEGEALDIQSILYTPEGKPRIAIFSIAHLSDPERMFFVSLLLNQILGWTRTQSGTTSLRAIVYMDEIYGFIPPVANPPSKTPFLTMLKQARAFGVGVVLATQNPVDLDYKGLSNAGTWFIGRLQTERDKMRMLDGLEGIAASSGKKWDSSGMEQTLAGLTSRVFLLNNVHDDSPVIFQTRWAMSYLRGPLTRNQIKKLMDPVLSTRVLSDASPAQINPVYRQPEAKSIPVSRLDSQQSVSVHGRPVLPPKIEQYFIPLRGRQPSGAGLFYRPEVVGSAKIHFTSVKAGVNIVKDAFYRSTVSDAPIAVDWEAAEEVDIAINDLESSTVNEADYGDVPAVAMKQSSFTSWGRDLTGWLYRKEQIEVFRSPGLKEYSLPDESERDFRVRLQQKARERRDEATDKLRRKYETKHASLQEQLRRAQAVVDREKEQAKQQKVQTALNFGSTILGAFLGSKVISAGTLSKAKSTMSGMSRTMKEAKDIERAKETVEATRNKIEKLENDFKADIEALADKIDPSSEELEKVAVRPAKKDITLQLIALGWFPYWKTRDGLLEPAW